MKYRFGGLSTALLIFVIAACTSTETGAEQTFASTTTVAAESPASRRVATSEGPTPTDETEPLTLVRFGCVTAWPGHRAVIELTFLGSEVTNTAGKTQLGILSVPGRSTLESLLGVIDIDAIPERHAGTRPHDPNDPIQVLLGDSTSSVCELELRGREAAVTYQWTEWPHDGLVELTRFIEDEVSPLAVCKTTESIIVSEPCSYIGID